MVATAVPGKSKWWVHCIQREWTAEVCIMQVPQWGEAVVRANRQYKLGKKLR